MLKVNKNETFTIVDSVNSDGIIAVREKSSVEINEEDNEVKMHDFIYTFEEIVAVADKLKSMKSLTFS